MQIIGNKPISSRETALINLLHRTIAMMDKETLEKYLSDRDWADLYWMLKQVYNVKI